MKQQRIGEKIRLTSIDELLGVPDGESTMEIPITEIHGFKNHPFKVLDDLRMQELVESIRINGVLTPVLVRPDSGNGYEMISGHRRLHAAIVLGLEKLPAIVRDLNDDESIIIMVDSNIQREELLPSEKAFAYKMKIDAMKRQGARHDLKPEGYFSDCKETVEPTSAQKGRKLETADILGEQVGESRMQIRRYIRLTYLIPELLDYVDKKKVLFTVAVEMSYFEPTIQNWLYEYIKENGTIRLQQVLTIKTQLQIGPITQSQLINMLNDTQPGRAASGRITLTEKKLREYFPKEYSYADMKNIIESLLLNWKESQSREEQ